MNIGKDWTAFYAAGRLISAISLGFCALIFATGCAGPKSLPVQPQSFSSLGPAEQAYSAYQKGDFQLARALWQTEADKGNLQAKYNLGIIYAEGRGINRDPAQAIKWWQEAAEQGHAHAQHNLALSYLAAESNQSGKIATPNKSNARHWLEKASSQGLAHSQYILARIIASGTFDNPNPQRVVDLYRKAAVQGHARAQDELAAVCYRGEGIEQDFVESYYWSSLADAQGIDKAKDRLSILRKNMSPRDIKTAKRRLSTSNGI